MRKTFQLHVEGKNLDRVLDAVKHEIRKYIKRERRRDLPEGADMREQLSRQAAEFELQLQPIAPELAPGTWVLRGFGDASPDWGLGVNLTWYAD